MIEIPTRSILRNDTERFRWLIVEGILVTDDVDTADAGQDAYFIQTVIDFFGGERVEEDFLNGVLLAVLFPACPVDDRKRPFS